MRGEVCLQTGMTIDASSQHNFDGREKNSSKYSMPSQFLRKLRGHPFVMNAELPDQPFQIGDAIKNVVGVIGGGFQGF